MKKIYFFHILDILPFIFKFVNMFLQIIIETMLLLPEKDNLYF